MKVLPGGIPDLSNLKKEKEEKPLLEVSLPASPSQDPREKLSYGAHNASHQANYIKIGSILKQIVDTQQKIIIAHNNLAKKVDLLEIKQKNGGKNE